MAVSLCDGRKSTKFNQMFNAVSVNSSRNVPAIKPHVVNRVTPEVVDPKHRPIDFHQPAAGCQSERSMDAAEKANAERQARW